MEGTGQRSMKTVRLRRYPEPIEFACTFFEHSHKEERV
jgi:hypothetical protein